VRALQEENVYGWLENVFREHYAHTTIHKDKSGDYHRTFFDSANLSYCIFADISFHLARNLTHENIWNFMSSLAQSSGSLNVGIRYSRLPNRYIRQSKSVRNTRANCD